MAIDASAEIVTPPGRRRRRGTAKVNLGLISVPLLWLIVFFLIPVVLVALYSVGVLTLISYDKYLSLELWRYFLHSDTYLGGPLGRGLFWKSLKMSFGVSITCVLLRMRRKSPANVRVSWRIRDLPHSRAWCRQGVP